MPNQTLQGRSCKHTDGPRSHQMQMRMCDEMTKEGDAGRNKAAARGPLRSDVESLSSGPGVAAKWWSGRRHLTVLILAGGDKMDLGSWPAGCGRRAPRSACWGEATSPGSAIFPRLLPRRCRQMSCTWMIHLLHRSAAWQALQGLTGRHRGGIIVTMIDESQCRTSDALPNSLATSGYVAALSAYHAWLVWRWC